MAILRLLIPFAILPLLALGVIKTKDSCSPKFTKSFVEKLISSTKVMSLKYGESKINFLEKEIEIQYGGKMKIFKHNFRLETPDISYKACSNEKGTPSQKTSYNFSPKGLKDISGSIYIRCGDDFLAFSIISPTGGVSSCILKNGLWQDF
jgi:hypothetical protein